MTGKPWFKSKSVLAQAVSAVCTVLTVVVGPQFSLGADEQAAIVTVIALASNLVGAGLRLVTKEPIRRR